jgi:hypothetical protein
MIQSVDYRDKDTKPFEDFKELVDILQNSLYFEERKAV